MKKVRTFEIILIHPTLVKYLKKHYVHIKVHFDYSLAVVP